MNHQRIVKLMSGQGSPLERAGLGALSVVYRGAVAGRNAMFETGVRSPRDLGRATISVGNLTTGGTGKTPMVIMLVERLIAMGRRPAILLRGYRGDEQRVYADYFENGSVPVCVEANPHRAAGAAAALERDATIDVFVLDDAFQHRQAKRDLDLVLIDATEPFGFGYVLPRGMLREPRENLKRADAVIVTHADLVSPEMLIDLDMEIATLLGKPPIAHAAHAWTGFCDEEGGAVAIDAFKDKRAHGVCGIGNPEAFFQTLVQHVAEPAYFTAKPDHHAYTLEELNDLFAAATEHELDAIITTEKDWVKWRELLPSLDVERPRIYRPTLAMKLIDGEAGVDALLASLNRGS